MRGAVGLFTCAIGLGCGAVAVLEDDGAGGQAGATTSGAPSATATTGASGATTGASACDEHADCPGGVCVFSTGLCAAPCSAEPCQSCGPGALCDTCATSSCPECADCRAACVPTPPGRCDDDDPCGDELVCLYETGFCAPSCASSVCADPNTFCAGCVTGSCCSCKDCVGACLPLEDG